MKGPYTELVHQGEWVSRISRGHLVLLAADLYYSPYLEDQQGFQGISIQVSKLILSDTSWKDEGTMGNLLLECSCPENLVGL